MQTPTAYAIKGDSKMNNNAQKIILDTKIYNIEAILNACYSFIERAYIFLDTDSNGNRIRVSIKGKKQLSQKQLEALKGEFMNELLHCALRHTVSKNNKKIREYIIGRALYSTIPSPDLLISEGEPSYQKDPLGIATSWKKKHGKKKKNSARAKI